MTPREHCSYAVDACKLRELLERIDELLELLLIFDIHIERRLARPPRRALEGGDPHSSLRRLARRLTQAAPFVEECESQPRAVGRPPEPRDFSRSALALSARRRSLVSRTASWRPLTPSTGAGMERLPPGSSPRS